MTKWFDYRFLTPLDATLQFMEDYEIVYRAMWKSTFDSSTADLKCGRAEKGLFANRREFSTFWNARVYADTLGVALPLFHPYVDGDSAAPREVEAPSAAGQLWNKPDCIEAVKTKWEEELAGRQAVSELAHYRPENFSWAAASGGPSGTRASRREEAPKHAARPG